MKPPIECPLKRVEYYYALVATIGNTEYGVIICDFADCKSPADLRVIGLSKFHATFDDSLHQLGNVEYPLFRIEIIGTTRYNYKNYWIGADQRPGRDCTTTPEQRRLTNKELSEWIAKGNGQGRVKGTNTANTFYMYDSNEDSEPVPTTIEVRKWGDTEWHEPTGDYCAWTVVKN